jgi:hypothetical protein
MKKAVYIILFICFFVLGLWLFGAKLPDWLVISAMVCGGATGLILAYLKKYPTKFE